MAELITRLQSALGDTYRVQHELGGGGMSRVFLAEEIELGRKVVIKVLPPDMAAGVNKERFQREIRLAASLQHPHVVPLLTAGQVDGDFLYYVMPYIEGESLRAKLAREGELPVSETIRILREVVDALAYAHQHEVVHRDIKPDNVMITGHHAVVTDFGVAKAVSASSGGTHSSLTSLGVALGTPSYMSPEQAAADPHVDHRADIYAVGALAYELLTGRPPFVKQTPQQVLAAQVSEAPEPVTAHRQAVSPALNELVMRCLAKRAADRWQTADELRVQLEAMTTPQSGGVTPTGTHPTDAVMASTVLRNHPVRVAALFGVAAAVTLVIVYALMIALGLPDWTFVAAIALLAIGLPIILVTGKHERARAAAATTGLHVTTPAGLTKHFTWRKSILGGGLAFVGLTVAAGGYMGTRAIGIGPAATLMSSGVLGQQEELILASFDNRTPDSTLGTTVTELMRVSLSQSTAIRVLDPARVSESLQRMQRDPSSPVDEKTALEIAERDGFKAILAGDVAPLGNGYIISARLVAATGEILTAKQMSASSADDLIRTVDELAGDLRERIGESLRSIRRTIPLDLVTTGSMQALRFFTQASMAEVAGDDDRAVDLLEEAVTVDTTFAMAYRKMGTILSNTDQQVTRRREAVTRAYELRHRLTDLERGYATAMYYSSVKGDLTAGLAAYRTIIEQYPDDHRALNNSGVLYWFLGDYEQAYNFWSAGVAVDSTWPIGFTNVAFISTLLGRDQGAQAMMDVMESLFPNNPRVPEGRADIAFMLRDYARADEHYREVLSSQSGNPQWQSTINRKLASSAAARGRLGEANRYWRASRSALEQRALPANLLRESLEWAFTQLVITGDVSASTRLAEASLQSTSIEDLPVADRPYEDVVRYFTSVGELDTARMYLDRMEQSRQAELGLQYQRQHSRSRGMVSIASGETVAGMREFRQGANGWVCHPCATAELARLHDVAGNADSARTYWQQYADARVFPIGLDATYLAASYRRLGELYEAGGDRQKAVEYYNRFVELWAEADAELQPIVEDARGRIARLVAEGS